MDWDENAQKRGPPKVRKISKEWKIAKYKKENVVLSVISDVEAYLISHLGDEDAIE